MENNQKTIDFSNLDLIPTLLEKIECLEKKISNIEKKLIPKLDLTKRAGVREYLGISDSAIYAMMNDGRLKQGVHYKKSLNGKRAKITFVESAIVNYKEKK